MKQFYNLTPAHFEHVRSQLISAILLIEGSNDQRNTDEQKKTYLREAVLRNRSDVLPNVRKREAVSFLELAIRLASEFKVDEQPRGT